MIVEVLGTGGAGKTTLEPLLADRLGIDYLANGKRKDLLGNRQSPIAVWASRLAAIGVRPGLFASACAGVPASLRDRIWFAMDLCRRERNARMAAGRGSGVLASGTLHALAQGSARFGTDLSRLFARVSHADVYVRLRLEARTAAERLADRREVGLERVGDHAEWTERYEMVLDTALARVRAVVIDVEAVGTPDEIAAAAVARMQPTGGGSAGHGG